MAGAEDQERDVMQIREHIAKAIQEADNMSCPDGYSESTGFGEHDWLSDWCAFLADHIKISLDGAGFVIVPKYRCDTCGKSFNSAKDKQRHRMDKHTPHRKISSKDRPADLGPVPCGYPECNQSFATEYNASQHRRDVHGETEPAAERCEGGSAGEGSMVMSVSATRPVEHPSGRKALDAQYVNSCMKSAMLALADVEKRRAWGNSKSGSPVATVALCQEIARLNIEREEVISILQAIFSMADEEIAVRFRTSSHKTEEQIAGKSVIYSVLSLARNMAIAGLAKSGAVPEKVG